jgi:hypothetical protein
MANVIQFKVDGLARSFDGDPEMPLLGYLRDTVGLLGRSLAAVSAFCEACTVHKNGDAIRACITPMSSLAGAARPGSVRVARSGEISAKSSVIGQSNFGSHPVARINEAHISPTFTWSRVMQGRRELVSPECRRLFRRCAMRSTPRRESVRELPLARTNLGKQS